jgi:hypothetical protein
MCLLGILGENSSHRIVLCAKQSRNLQLHGIPLPSY